MGADYYEDEEKRGGRVPIGIGGDCRIDQAIIDKSARLGAGSILDPTGMADLDNENWYIRDGIIVVPKDAQIPAGTVVKKG